MAREETSRVPRAMRDPEEGDGEEAVRQWLEGLGLGHLFDCFIENGFETLEFVIR